MFKEGKRGSVSGVKLCSLWIITFKSMNDITSKAGGLIHLSVYSRMNETDIVTLFDFLNFSLGNNCKSGMLLKTGQDFVCAGIQFVAFLSSFNLQILLNSRTHKSGMNIGINQLRKDRICLLCVERVNSIINSAFCFFFFFLCSIPLEHTR